MIHRSTEAEKQKVLLISLNISIDFLNVKWLLDAHYQYSQMYDQLKR